MIFVTRPHDKRLICFMLRERATGISHILITLILCVPILLVTYPPLVDYPSHLARVAILTRYSDVPLFVSKYQVIFEPVANLAIESIVLPAARFIGVIAAGKLFLLGIVAMYSLGCWNLDRAVAGRHTWMSLLPLPWIYSSTLLMGFVNYAFGVAVFLVALAFWIRVSTSRRPLHVAFFAVLASACYLAHLVSFALLAICVLMFEIWQLKYKRITFSEFLYAPAALSPAVLMYIAFMSGSGRIGRIEWNSVSGKVIALLATVRSYDVKTDVIIFAALLVIALCALYVVKWQVYKPLFFPGVALLILFVLSPKVLLTSSGADARFVWPALVLLTLSLRPINVDRRKGAALLVAFFAVYFARTGVIAATWLESDAKAAAIVSLLNELPPESRVYPAFFATDGADDAKIDHGLEHVVSYAVISRNAYVPTVFAIRGQQPLVDVSRRRYREWSEGREDVFRGYEYVLTYKAPEPLLDELRQSATLIASAGESTVWLLHRD